MFVFNDTASSLEGTKRGMLAPSICRETKVTVAFEVLQVQISIDKFLAI